MTVMNRYKSFKEGLAGVGDPQSVVLRAKQQIEEDLRGKASQIAEDTRNFREGISIAARRVWRARETIKAQEEILATEHPNRPDPRAVAEWEARRAQAEKIIADCNKIVDEVYAMLEAWHVTPEDLEEYVLGAPIMERVESALEGPPKFLDDFGRWMEREGFWKEISVQEFEEQDAKYRETQSERSKKRDGKPFDAKIAGRYNLPVIQIRGDAGMCYYAVVAGSSQGLGEAAMATIRRCRWERTERSRSFHKEFEELKRKHGLEGDGDVRKIVLEGRKGLFAVQAFVWKDQQSDGDEHVGAVISSNGEEELTVLGLVSDNPGTIHKYYVGRTYRFSPDEERPDLRDVDRMIQRLVFKGLRNAGWVSQGADAGRNGWSNNAIGNALAEAKSGRNGNGHGNGHRKGGDKRRNQRRGRHEDEESHAEA